MDGKPKMVLWSINVLANNGHTVEYRSAMLPADMNPLKAAKRLKDNPRCVKCRMHKEDFDDTFANNIGVLYRDDENQKEESNQ